MKTVLVSLALMQPVQVAPKICEPVTVNSYQQLVCCREASGRQCCARQVDSNGRPKGCNC